MAGMPKKLERLHCPRRLPLTAVAKQKGETRACVIATGLWVPYRPRFHSVAPKVPSGFGPLARYSVPCLAVL